MSETIARPISGTGSFPALDLSRAPRQAVAGGKSEVPTGKSLPAEPATRDLEKVAEQLNQQGPSIGRKLRFEVDLASGRSVIHVLDRETGELIRQIPPEDLTPYLVDDGLGAIRLYDDVV